MNDSPKIIAIEWEGPLSPDVIQKTCNRPMDRGLYQIYGTHSVLGPNSLLYLGKTEAEDQTFSKRIPRHSEWIEWEATPVEVYLGRLGGVDRMSSERDSEWVSQIAIAERLLIFFSTPLYNSQGLKDYGMIEDPVLVINYKRRNRLPIEVSTYHETVRNGGDWKVYEL